MPEKRQCAASAGRGRMGIGPCVINATRPHGSKWYCHIHDPATIAARRDNKDARFRMEQDAMRKRDDDRRRCQRIGRLVEALAARSGSVSFIPGAEYPVFVQVYSPQKITRGHALIETLEAALADNEGGTE